MVLTVLEFHKRGVNALLLPLGNRIVIDDLAYPQLNDIKLHTIF